MASMCPPTTGSAPNEADPNSGHGATDRVANIGEAVQGCADLMIGVAPVSPRDLEKSTTAFRELYQNFRDGIVQVRGIRPEQLKTGWITKNVCGGQALIVVFFNKDTSVVRYFTDASGKQKTQRLLYGFIKFHRRKNEEKGEVSLVNFENTINASAFRMWHSSKRSPAQAGRHGEGLKNAARNLVGAGYSLVIESGDRKYRFVNDQGSLGVRWTTPDDGNEQREKWVRYGYQQKRGFDSHIWEDTAVRIGDDIDPSGRAQSPKISEDTFREWLKVTCDINGPTSKISTDDGDLILDDHFKGNAYFMGLKLNRSASGSKSFHYGYNIRRGQIGQDRESLKSARYEAQLLQSIWSAAIKKYVSHSADVPTGVDPRKKLANLLENHPEAADVAMAKTYMRKDTASAVWEYLLEEARRDIRFFIPRGDKAAARLVRHCLHMTPAELNEEFCDLLSEKVTTFRTPQKEREHRFRACEPINPGNWSTSNQEMYWTLAAMVQIYLAILHRDSGSSPATHINVTLAQCEDLYVYCLYLPEETTLMVNGGLFTDVARVTRTAGATNENVSKLQLCRREDHIKKWFWKAIVAISEASKSPQSLEVLLKIADEAQVILSCMPMDVRCKPTGNAGELEVSWQLKDHLLPERHLEDADTVVQIHDEDCNQWNPGVLYKDLELGALLATKQEEEATVWSRTHSPLISSACGCGGGRTIISAGQRTALFNELDRKKEYFASVARKAPLSIFSTSFETESPSLNRQATGTNAQKDREMDICTPPLTPSESAAQILTRATQTSEAANVDDDAIYQQSIAGVTESSCRDGTQKGDNTSVSDRHGTLVKGDEILIQNAVAFSSSDYHFHKAKTAIDDRVEGVLVTPRHITSGAPQDLHWTHMSLSSAPVVQRPPASSVSETTSSNVPLSQSMRQPCQGGVILPPVQVFAHRFVRIRLPPHILEAEARRHALNQSALRLKRSMDDELEAFRAIKSRRIEKED